MKPIPSSARKMFSFTLIILFATCVLSEPSRVSAADQTQWGQRHSRNMVSPEKGLPSEFDPETGRNIKWSVSLGRRAYVGPSIGSGKVLVGADNSTPRDPRHEGDLAVLLCLDEATGEMLWQLAVPRITGDIYLDWPRCGLCSIPTIEGDRAYVVTNRYEVICLDMRGMADGNDGIYQDEAEHMMPEGETPVPLSPKDADILWLFDMRTEVGMYPHDSAHTSILLDGDLLYLNTCNGVDNTHKRIRAPEAPSLIVLNKNTGELVAQDAERIGPRIFHSTWSSPAMGEIEGQKRVFFCGGDGICYAFEAVDAKATEGKEVLDLHRVWRYDGDPNAPKENVHEYLRNRREGPSNVKSMPVFHKNRIYLTLGGDIWWGKEKAWLKCVDATLQGDITDEGTLWSFPLEKHSSSTPAIFQGLVFVADCGGNLYCLDAETGDLHWSHDLGRETWSSPLVADGKVYIGTRGGDFWVFQASPQKKLISSVDLGTQITSSPVAANGVLYVATLQRLYAIAKEE